MILREEPRDAGHDARSPDSAARARALRAFRGSRRAVFATYVLIAATIALLVACERRAATAYDRSRGVARAAREAVTLAGDWQRWLREYLLTRERRYLGPTLAARDRLVRTVTPLEAPGAPGDRARDVRAALAQWDREVSPMLNGADAPPARRAAELRASGASYDRLRGRLDALIASADAATESRRRREAWLHRVGLLVLLVETALTALLAFAAQHHAALQGEEVVRQNERLQEQATELELALDDARRADDARDEARALLDAALASAPVGLGFFDDDLRVERANPALRSMSPAPDPTADTLFTMLPELGDQLEPLLREVWSDEPAPRGHEVVLEGAGPRRTWLASSYPVRVAGRTARAGLVLLETTERRQLENALRQAQKMDALGQLAGGVAHDSNNILTAILSYAHLALDTMPLDDPARADVEEIVRAARRGAGLTRQLLAFTRKQVVHPEPLDVNEVLLATRGMLRRLIGDDVELITRLAAAVPPVRADRSQLEQVVVNLVVNARDAMPDGGALLLETSVIDVAHDHGTTPPELGAGRWVVLSMSDTGVGIDDAVRPHLFEPFFTTKPHGEGTGIGLSTVYGIVRQAGGHIGVQSEPGHGATFRVWLPADEHAPPASAPAPDDFAVIERSPGARVATVLLAEDDDAIRSAVERLLLNQGHTVLAARDGDEALGLCAAREGAIDVLLTDVVMPRLGGAELARRARLLHPELRVVFMSGYTAGRLGGAEPAGAMEFLEKPFTPEALQHAVLHALAAPAPAEEPAVTSPSTPTARVALALARDATLVERRAAESRRREIEGHHRAVVDALSEGVVLCDLRGLILAINWCARRILGLGGTEVIGLHIEALPWRAMREDGTRWPPDEHPTLAVLRSGSPQTALAQLERRWIDIHARLLHHATDGSPYAVLWTFKDVTRRHEAERALRRAKVAADAASRAKSDFLDRMSHELRTPLTSIIAYAQLLLGRRTPLPPQERDMIERIHTNGQRLAGIVTSILEFSESQSNDLVVARREVDVASLVRGVVEAHADRAAPAVRVAAEVPTNLEALATDPEHLRRVLELLLDNALKFTERGTVTVAVLADAHGAPTAIEVRDSGIGLPAARGDEIFEPFEQAEGSSTRQFGGVGMGLPLARALCRAMGATLTAHDGPDGGAVFRVAFTDH